MTITTPSKLTISIRIDGMTTVAASLSPLGKAARSGDEALVREMMASAVAQVKATRLASEAAIVRRWSIVSFCDFLARNGRDMILGDNEGRAVSYAGVY